MEGGEGGYGISSFRKSNLLSRWKREGEGGGTAVTFKECAAEAAESSKTGKISPREKKILEILILMGSSHFIN